jgi:hypothetical protein
MRRLTAAAAAAAVLPLLLAACSPDAGDFASEAENYIESRGFSEEAGLLRYSEVECEEPASTDVDTRYTCTATAEDGTRWLFEVEITGDEALKVITPPAPLDGETASTSPDETAATEAGTVAATSSTAPRRTTTSPASPSTTARPAATTTTAP